MKGGPDTELSEDARALARALLDAGHDAVVVGGAVRDSLMGRGVTDVDLVTDATPDQIRSLTHGVDWARSTYAVGERFGTLGVVLSDGGVVEVSRYREPALIGTTTAERFAADAELRDFTVDAMGFDLSTGELLDPLDGRIDIHDMLLRAPEDPAARFAEDPLRVLRAARLVAELGFDVEAATFEAVAGAALGLEDVAVERIRDELTKLLVSSHPGRGLDQASRSGALAVVLPEVAALDGVEQPTFHDLDALAHTIQTVQNVAPTPVLRWAALLHDVGKGPTRSVEADGRIRFFGHSKVGAVLAEAICRRLRLSKADTAAIVHLVQEHMRLGELDVDNDRAVDRAVRKLDARQRGADTGQPLVSAEQVLELTMADFEATAHRDEAEPVRRRLAEAIAASRQRGTETAVTSPLSGDELMKALNINEGEGVGLAKKAIEAAILNGTLNVDDRARALDVARNALLRRPRGESS